MPSAVDLAKRRKELEQVPLGHLKLRGPVFRRGAHLYILASCSACGLKREYVVNNVLSGRTRDCRCQRSVKYGKNPLARVFGQRYDTIRQRCLNKSNFVYSSYGGTGIKCNFETREGFVRYLLRIVAEKHPEIKSARTLAVYDIERIRPNGHFQPGNLRLVRRNGTTMSANSSAKNRATSCTPGPRRGAHNRSPLQTRLAKKEISDSRVLVRANLICCTG